MGRKRAQKRNEGPQSTNSRTLTEGQGHGRQKRAQTRATQRLAANQVTVRNLHTHEHQVTADIHPEPRAQPGRDHLWVEPVTGQRRQPGPSPGTQPVQQDQRRAAPRVVTNRIEGNFSVDETNNTIPITILMTVL